MENKEIIFSSKDIDGHHPVMLDITNSNNNGQWVDIFRHIKYSGIEINCPYSDMVGGISYDEFVDAFKNENRIVGLFSILSTVPFADIEKENQKIHIINWDVKGISMDLPIEYPDTKDQHHKGIIQICRTFLTDYKTFIRVWSPANSKTTISLFTKK